MAPTHLADETNKSPTTIFCLPLEILTDIFIHRARDDYYYPIWGPNYRSMLKWVNITHVCRLWRNAALNCPILWSYIPKTSRRWTGELLARSNQAPLKIFAKSASPSESLLLSRIFEPVADHVERIEELHLHLWFHGTSDYQRLFKFLFAPAPRLRRLKIFNICSGMEHSPLLLFQGETPALRQLELPFCLMVSLDSSTLGGLTTLKLTNPCNDVRLNIAKLLEVLPHLPSLEHLDFEDALTSTRATLSGRAFDATSRINLSRLASLSMKGPLSTIVAFLPCVNIPLKAQLSLHQRDRWGASTVNEYKQFLPLLIQRFNPDLGDLAFAIPAIRSLVIQSDFRSHTVQLVCSTLQQTANNPAEWASNFLLDVVLNVQALLDADRIISDICRSIPLSSVENIFFDHLPWSSGFWQEVLGRYPNSRAFKLWNSGCGMPTDMITRLLPWTTEDSTQDSGAEQGPNLIFSPRLEGLPCVIAEWDQMDWDLVDWSSMDWIMMVPDVADLDEDNEYDLDDSDSE